MVLSTNNEQLVLLKEQVHISGGGHIAPTRFYSGSEHESAQCSAIFTLKVQLVEER